MDHRKFMQSVYDDNCLEVAFHLKDRNLNINHRDEKSHTALHIAIYQSNVAMLEMLLNHDNINIEMKTSYGLTPLHWACMKDTHNEIIQLLLFYGANPNNIDYKLHTPLHFAAETAPTSIVEMLLMFGANPHCISHDGFTPSELALRARKYGNVGVLSKYARGDSN